MINKVDLILLYHVNLNKLLFVMNLRILFTAQVAEYSCQNQVQIFVSTRFEYDIFFPILEFGRGVFRPTLFYPTASPFTFTTIFYPRRLMTHTHPAVNTSCMKETKKTSASGLSSS